MKKHFAVSIHNYNLRQRFMNIKSKLFGSVEGLMEIKVCMKDEEFTLRFNDGGSEADVISEGKEYGSFILYDRRLGFSGNNIVIGGELSI